MARIWPNLRQLLRPSLRTVVLACVRNEGPWLLEWVAHYHELGFDELWVCSNDLTDGSEALLDRLAALGLVRHFRNEVPPNGSPQDLGYELMRRNPAFSAFDWALVVDADEFLVLPPGVGLQDFLLARRQHAAIAINWMVFGCDRQIERRAGPVATRFRSCIPQSISRHYKCFMRPRDTARIHIHFPKLSRHRQVFHCNGMPLNELSGFTMEADHGPAQINHYITKSIEELCAKARRGRGAAAELRSTEFLIQHARLGGSPDGAIDRYRDGTDVRMAAMAADPEIAAALEAIDAWYRTLVREPENVALKAQVADAVFFAEGGRCLGVKDGQLHGWVTVPRNRADRFIVMVDGVFVGEVEAGEDKGRPAFAVTLPERLIDNAQHLVVVHVLNRGVQVAGHVEQVALRLVSPSVITGCRGSIDGVSDGHLRGWLTTVTGLAMPGCRISIDGCAPHAAVPDRPRPDLVAPAHGGRIAFALPLSTAFCDSAWHHVAVEALDERGAVVGSMVTTVLFNHRGWPPGSLPRTPVVDVQPDPVMDAPPAPGADEPETPVDASPAAPS